MKKSSFNLIFFGLIVIALDYCYNFLPTTYFYMGVLFVFLGISSEVFPYLSKIKRFSKAQIQQIDSMDGIEFEEYWINVAISGLRLRRSLAIKELISLLHKKS
ncbi:hypothetical protein IGI53_001231 [Enterococcus sp. DIV0788_1]